MQRPVVECPVAALGARRRLAPVKALEGPNGGKERGRGFSAVRSLGGGRGLDGPEDADILGRESRRSVSGSERPQVGDVVLRLAWHQHARLAAGEFELDDDLAGAPIVRISGVLAGERLVVAAIEGAVVGERPPREGLGGRGGVYQRRNRQVLTLQSQLGLENHLVDDLGLAVEDDAAVREERAALHRHADDLLPVLEPEDRRRVARSVDGHFVLLPLVSECQLHLNYSYSRLCPHRRRGWILFRHSAWKAVCRCPHEPICWVHLGADKF